MLGGGGANLHPSIFWPQWGTQTWQLLEDGAWDEAQDQVNRVLIPYYEIVGDIGAVTGGEGHIDKVALEMLGLPGGRNRPHAAAAARDQAARAPFCFGGGRARRAGRSGHDLRRNT